VNLLVTLEDVGGVGGYMDFLQAMRDPTHEEHEAMWLWSGGASAAFRGSRRTEAPCTGSPWVGRSPSDHEALAGPHRRFSGELPSGSQERTGHVDRVQRLGAVEADPFCCPFDSLVVIAV
jgi:hypothetical protein